MLKLPVLKCEDSNQHVTLKSRPCVTLQCDNSFAELEVENNVEHAVDNEVESGVTLTCKDACTSVVAPTSESCGQGIDSQPVRVCILCGRKNKRRDEQCYKCANRSFSHLEK